MGLTSKYQFPYPEPTDSVDVVRDVKALADRNEAVMAALALTYVQAAGTENNQGAAGATVASSAHVILTPGVWVLFGALSIACGVAGVKAAWVPTLVNYGTATEPAGAPFRGGSENSAALGELTMGHIRSHVITVPAGGMDLQIAALCTNVGQVLVLQSTGASTPSGWLTGVRLTV